MSDLHNPILSVRSDYLMMGLSSGETVMSKVFQVDNQPTDSIVLDNPIRILIGNNQFIFMALNAFSFADKITVMKHHIVWVDIPDNTMIKKYTEYLAKQEDTETKPSIN